MCGICGFTFEDKLLLRRMCKLIAHRGNDDEGFHFDRNISLGHRRLSIIDLEGGRQPIYNEDKGICVVYNGEIYNFPELKSVLEKKGHRFYTNTDTEVIVHAYEEWGTDNVKRFNGMYAFCLWDSKKKALFLARDRLGIKPLFYTVVNGNFAFASELKALMALPGFDATLNPKAIDLYLTFRAALGETCMFSSVKKLLPGHTLLWKDGKIRVKKYWDIKERFLCPRELSATKNVRALLEDSVKKHMIADVPVGAYLSGGLDSSAVVGLMSKYGTIKTFSIGFGSEFDELDYARTASEAFGTEHHEIYIKEDAFKLLPKIAWYFDEPVADPAAIPTYVLSEATRKECKVVLTGEGGDEVFAGYEQYKFIMLKEKLGAFSKIGGALLDAVPRNILSQIFPYTRRLGCQGIIRAKEFLKEEDLGKSYMNIISVFNEKESCELLGRAGYSTKFLSSAISHPKHPLNKIELFELKYILPDNLLAKVDRMTMAHSLEARVPLLDHRIVEYMFSMHPSVRFKNLESKYLFKKSMKDIVPQAILKRKKQRFFVPIDDWLEKREALGYIEDFYLRGNEKTGLKINPKYIRNALENYNNSKLFYARQLWSLINLAIWYETFVEEISRFG